MRLRRFASVLRSLAAARIEGKKLGNKGLLVRAALLTHCCRTTLSEYPANRHRYAPLFAAQRCFASGSIMSIGLDAIPLDVLRGVVAFATGRFTVGRLDGGVKVCGPEFQAWSAHEERQTTARDLRALVGALGFHQLRCVSRQWRATADEHLRMGRACDAVLAQLPLNKHGRNPSNYGDSKVY